MNDPWTSLREIGDELLAIRRSGPIHDAEEAAILLEDVIGLSGRVDALRTLLFEEIHRVERRFHTGYASGTETFQEIDKLLIRFSQGTEWVIPHLQRHRLDSDGRILLPIPQCLEVETVRRLHGDLPVLRQIEERLQQTTELLDMLDAIGVEIPHLLQSEHLQRYWLEQLGYLEIESVCRWLESSLAGVDRVEGREELEEAPVPDFPHAEYLPGTLFLDEEGLMLGRFQIQLDSTSLPVTRTISMATLPTGTGYPWNVTPPEALLGMVRRQQERLEDRLKEPEFRDNLQGDEEDVLEL